jgi:hypothetical protein
MTYSAPQDLVSHIQQLIPADILSGKYRWLRI